MSTPNKISVSTTTGWKNLIAGTTDKVKIRNSAGVWVDVVGKIDPVNKKKYILDEHGHWLALDTYNVSSPNPHPAIKYVGAVVSSYAYKPHPRMVTLKNLGVEHPDRYLVCVGGVASNRIAYQPIILEVNGVNMPFARGGVTSSLTSGAHESVVNNVTGYVGAIPFPVGDTADVTMWLRRDKLAGAKVRVAAMEFYVVNSYGMPLNPTMRVDAQPLNRAGTISPTYQIQQDPAGVSVNLVVEVYRKDIDLTDGETVLNSSTDIHGTRDLFGLPWVGNRFTHAHLTLPGEDTDIFSVNWGCKTDYYTYPKDGGFIATILFGNSTFPTRGDIVNPPMPAEGEAKPPRPPSNRIEGARTPSNLPILGMWGTDPKIHTIKTIIDSPMGSPVTLHGKTGAGVIKRLGLTMGFTEEGGNWYNGKYYPVGTGYQLLVDGDIYIFEAVIYKTYNELGMQESNWYHQLLIVGSVPGWTPPAGEIVPLEIPYKEGYVISSIGRKGEIEIWLEDVPS